MRTRRRCSRARARGGELPLAYTPFAALLFAARGGASFATWQVGLAVLTIGLLPVVAYLSLGLAGRPAGRARATAGFAIAAVSLWLGPVAMTLFFGQIDLVLLALVVGDLALPTASRARASESGWRRGSAHAVDLHSVPAVHAASKGRGGQHADLRDHGRVWVRAAAARLRRLLGREVRPAGRKPFHLDNQSLKGVILRLTHAGPDAHAYWLVAAVVVGIAGLATSILASRGPTSYSAWLRAPRPACWCPRSPGRTTTFTWYRHLSSPRTGHGASATGSSAPRWWWLVWLVARAYWQPGRLRP